MPHAYAATSWDRVAGAYYGPPGRDPRGGPGGWWLLLEPELHFGEDVLVPDLAGWRQERMPVVPERRLLHARSRLGRARCSRRPPPGSTAPRKMAVYAREGIGHLWLVDPLAQTLEVYRLESRALARRATHGGDEVVRAEPFDAVDIGSLWSVPDEPGPSSG